MNYIGKSLHRTEDHRFLTGTGRFVEDIDLPGQLWAQVVRSPHAHASIVGIDTAAALGLPGVLAVYAYDDIAGLGTMGCPTQVTTVEPMKVPPRPALAHGRVRHVGDPVAFVVAETRTAARDGAEAVTVSYDSLPCTVDGVAAMVAGAPVLWDEVAGNVSYRFQKGDADAVRVAFAAATHSVELELINNRLVIAPTETRAGIGRYGDDGFELILTAAGVHAIRDMLAGVFGVGNDRMRVVAPDVGGGFGIKNALYPEWVLLLFAARALGRPVKWVAERAEDFNGTAQGRDNVTKARLALDADGRFLALDVHTVANLGAYMSSGGPGSSTNAPANAMGSGYVIPAIFMDVHGVFTNTLPIEAYRGAGKPEVNYMIERLVDVAAKRLGMDRAALRRLNLVSTFPYRKALGTVIDCGRFAANIDDAAIEADRAGFAKRRAESEAKGLRRGLGISCFLETARGSPNEGAELRFEADGRIAILVGTQSNGMGHETTYPQIAGDLLGLPPEIFRYVQADTGIVRAGNGHGGARSMHMGGAALVKAIDTMLDKARPVAARMLQAEQVSFAEGRFLAIGAPAREIGLTDVAAAVRDTEESLDTYVWNLLDIITFPNGCHIAEVEVDSETGHVRLDRYTAVDDFGTVINPMLTLGQIHGGVAQGIGQAMLEHTVYDPSSGQLLSGSFMDYAIPRADDLPDFDITLTGVSTNANPLGVKGAGQAGAIAAPQAVVLAVLDALAIEKIDMPLTPERVWRAIQTGRRP
jgi:carbon-monoxide dehydrogenase large subunit